MKAFLGFLVFTALTAIIPLYGNFIYDRYKAHEWRRAALHSVVALLFVSVIFVLGYYGWSVQTARDARRAPKLEYFTSQNFSDEVALRKQMNLLAGLNLDQHLQIIKTKFDEAEYAQNKNDFDRAIQLYTEIQRGSDRNGTFVKVPSACIESNMAVDLFRKQGDRQFRASSLLLDAVKIEPKPQDQLDLIQRNIDALDQYVNH